MYLPNVEAKGTPTSVQSYNVCNVDEKKIKQSCKIASVTQNNTIS